MPTTLVHVQVKPEYQDAFVAATLENCAASRQETGNQRFDLLQSDTDPNAFILVETYETADQAKAHKTTAHYATWRDTVAPMMAEPRRGEAFQMLSPKPDKEA